MAVVGSEIDDPNLIRLIENCGALVVADRFCYGSFPGRQEIALTQQEDALTQVCRWYLQNTECPRQSALHRVKYRNDHVAQLVREFKADGAIYEQMKFCTYWSYERVIANQIMPRDYGIPILSVDRPYIVGQSGQLRTRVQAFVESVEEFLKNKAIAPRDALQCSILADGLVAYSGFVKGKQNARQLTWKERQKLEDILRAMFRLPAEHTVVGLKKLLDLNRAVVKPVFLELDEANVVTFIRENSYALRLGENDMAGFMRNDPKKRRP